MFSKTPSVIEFSRLLQNFAAWKRVGPYVTTPLNQNALRLLNKIVPQSSATPNSKGNKKRPHPTSDDEEPAAGSSTRAANSLSTLGFCITSSYVRCSLVLFSIPHSHILTCAAKHYHGI